jgi:hypothetical protein
MRTDVDFIFTKQLAVAHSFRQYEYETSRAPMNQDTRSPRIANLFIVGAPKCGTTAWFEYLRSHPDIFFPGSKEHCYFAFDLPRFRFVHSEAEYSELFAESSGTKIVGEASAMYLFSTAAAAAIAEYNHDAKILICLRPQEEYLPSLHNQFLREFSEEISDFATAWKLSGQRPAESIPPKCLEPRTLNYAAMGRFDEQVERYLSAFPADQIYVLWYHEWTAHPRATYLRILDFLGLEDDGRTQFPVINKGVTYRSRGFVRFIFHPPPWLRKAVSLVKRITGLKAQTISVGVRRTINLLSAPGYKTHISEDLREEIRRYYSEDNTRLKNQLLHAANGQKRLQSVQRSGSAGVSQANSAADTLSAASGSNPN